MRARSMLVASVLALACRSGDPSCRLDGDACENGGTCSGGSCVVCGADGSACAEGGTCSGGVCLRDVQGTYARVQWLEGSGEGASSPVDLSGWVVKALVPERAGGYRERLGTGHADGTFEIADVPLGRYWLQVSEGFPSFREHTESVIAYRDRWSGRAAERAAESTMVHWDVSGMEPWVPGRSRLEMFSSSPRYWIPVDLDGTVAGATAARFDASTVPLFDGALGDRIWLSQLGEGSVDGRAYLTTVRAVQLPGPFKVEDGVEQTVSVPLEAVTADRPLTLDWRFAEFAALARDAGLRTGWDALGPMEHAFRIYAAPPAVPWEILGTLLEVEVTDEALDAVIGPISYGAFLPEGWTAVPHASAEIWFQRYDTQTRLQIYAAAYFSSVPQIDLDGRAAIAPTIGPPRSIRLAAHAPDASPPDGIGTTPLVSWDPPRLGRAAGYVVRIRRPHGFLQGVFYTTRTQVAVPFGLLQPDRTHYVSVAAYDAEGGYAVGLSQTFVPEYVVMGSGARPEHHPERPDVP